MSAISSVDNPPELPSGPPHSGKQPPQHQHGSGRLLCIHSHAASSSQSGARTGRQTLEAHSYTCTGGGGGHPGSGGSVTGVISSQGIPECVVAGSQSKSPHMHTHTHAHKKSHLQKIHGEDRLRTVAKHKGN